MQKNKYHIFMIKKGQTKFCPHGNNKMDPVKRTQEKKYFGA